jgi:hypothetical protein
MDLRELARSRPASRSSFRQHVETVTAPCVDAGSILAYDRAFGVGQSRWRWGGFPGLGFGGDRGSGNGEAQPTGNEGAAADRGDRAEDFDLGEAQGVEAAAEN